MYEGYVPMAYNDYLKTMKRSETLSLLSVLSTGILIVIYYEHRNGEWGDHVTLQAAADWVLTQPLLFVACTMFLCKKKESSETLTFCFDVIGSLVLGCL